MYLAEAWVDLDSSCSRLYIAVVVIMNTFKLYNNKQLSVVGFDTSASYIGHFIFR